MLMGLEIMIIVFFNNFFFFTIIILDFWLGLEKMH